MNVELALCVLLGWIAVVFLFFLAGVVQALWNATHGLPWGPLDTLGAPTALALALGGGLVAAIAMLVIAIRGL